MSIIMRGDLMPTESIKVTAPGVGTVTLDRLEPWVQARIRQQIQRITPSSHCQGEVCDHTCDCACEGCVKSMRYMVEW